MLLQCSSGSAPAQSPLTDAEPRCGSISSPATPLAPEAPVILWPEGLLCLNALWPWPLEYLNSPIQKGYEEGAHISKHRCLRLCRAVHSGGKESTALKRQSTNLW